MWRYAPVAMHDLTLPSHAKCYGGCPAKLLPAEPGRSRVPVCHHLLNLCHHGCTLQIISRVILHQTVTISVIQARHESFDYS